MSYVEKCKILHNMAGGLLRRLYILMKECADSATRPQVLTNSDLERCRYKIESKFPEVPDLSKIPGEDKLIASVIKCANTLMLFEDLVMDILDFSKVSIQVLQDMPREIVEFNVSVTRTSLHYPHKLPL
jgi:hypothetical protein